MTPEAYALHRERVLYLSEHPLIGRGRVTDLEEKTRQLTLEEVAR